MFALTYEEKPETTSGNAQATLAPDTFDGPMPFEVVGVDMKAVSQTPSQPRRDRVISLHRESYYSQLLSELRDLFTDPDPEFVPSDYAYSHALELVRRTKENLQMRRLFSDALYEGALNFPYGYAYGDGENGIRIEFEHGPKEIRIRVPKDSAGREYLYYQEGEQHDVEEPLTADLLLDRLLWLMR